MKWFRHPKIKAEVGNERTASKFAWLPTEMTQKIHGKIQVIWLEPYLADQRYETRKIKKYFDAEHGDGMELVDCTDWFTHCKRLK